MVFHVGTICCHDAVVAISVRALFLTLVVEIKARYQAFRTVAKLLGFDSCSCEEYFSVERKVTEIPAKYSWHIHCGYDQAMKAGKVDSARKAGAMSTDRIARGESYVAKLLFGDARFGWLWLPLLLCLGYI